MLRFVVVAALLVTSASVSAGGEVAYPSIRNAHAIVKAIISKADFVRMGFETLASVAEIKALGELGDCEPTGHGEARANLVVFDWKCGDDGSNDGDRMLTLRFTDDGSLFAFAINPMEKDFAPTDAGVKLADWPAREETAKNFAQAVVMNDDASLGRLIPLTSLHEVQLKSFAGGEWSIVHYMSKRERRDARRLLGQNIKIAEAPEKAIEIRFNAEASVQAAPEKLTLYFDKSDRVIGVYMEDDLTRVAALPVKGV